MTGVSNPTTDSARLVLAEAKKAFADDSLTEQGLRDILQTVKDAIASLESIKESQSATKDGGQTAIRMSLKTLKKNFKKQFCSWQMKKALSILKQR
ncbi:Uncharacterised protein [Streptococcus pneumoniae]|nr:Uncharacterised protein [Streptococcus pneumoniae]